MGRERTKEGKGGDVQ